MSSISVAGDVSGAISIAAPSAAGSGVLTLPTGTDTLVGKATTDTLTNKSIAATQLTGTIAAAALPAGSVIQVVQGTTSTTVTSSTNSFVDTGLTATITPRSTSSNILVVATHTQNIKSNGSASNAMSMKLLRGATQLTVTDSLGFTGTAISLYFSNSISYYDAPATTSATTYKTQFMSSNNTANVQVQGTSVPSSITLMEIQG